MKSIIKGSNVNQNSAHQLSSTHKQNNDGGQHETKLYKKAQSGQADATKTGSTKQLLQFKTNTSSKNAGTLKSLETKQNLTTPKNNKSKQIGSKQTNAQIATKELGIQQSGFEEALQADHPNGVNIQKQVRKTSNEMNAEQPDQLLNKNENAVQKKLITTKDKQEFKNLFTQVLAQGSNAGGISGERQDIQPPNILKVKDDALFVKKKKSSTIGEQNLRCRTQTPSRAINIAQEEHNNKYESQHLNQVIQISGLTVQNLEQFDLANRKMLQKRIVKSPSKIYQQYKERQQRAENLRSQIEKNRMERMEKIRIRQQDAHRRLDKKEQEKLQQEKLTRLNQKIDHARENRNIEISNIIQKAQNDLQIVEDIKYINKMQTLNNQMDYNNKLNETEERRNQLIKEKLEKLDDFKQKEEQAHRKRLHMQTLKRLRLQQYEDKLKIAMQKKKDLNNEKKRQSKFKRERVLQRKSNIGKQNLNLMQIVGNKDNVWDLIGQEEKFKDQRNFVEKDPISLEKWQLIQDSQFLDKIISFGPEGKMQVNFPEEADCQILQKMLKNNEFLENSTDEEPDNDSIEDNISSKIQYMVRNRIFNEDNQSSSSHKQVFDFTINVPTTNSNVRKNSSEHDKNSTFAEESENSYKQQNLELNGNFDSAPNDVQQVLKRFSDVQPSQVLGQTLVHNVTTPQKYVNLRHKNHQAELFNSSKSQNLYMQCSQPFITDEEEELILIESRINMALKRNVLRDTISEDLEWAYCIKNEYEDFDKIRYEQVSKLNIQETRSLENTPERPKNSQKQRENSCDRIFGSASSRRRFKRSSRINSRRSSMSSTIHQGLNKSKSKDQLHTIGSSSVFLESKSIQFLNKDGSKTKRQYRDSSKGSNDSQFKGRSSFGGTQPKTLFMNNSSISGVQQFNLFEETTKDDFSVGQCLQSNFGSQMNQLITSMKPQNSMNFVSFRLSPSALKYIFPIKEQKILFKRPGKDGQFASARVIIKLEDTNSLNLLNTVQAESSSTQQRASHVKEQEPPAQTTQQQNQASAQTHSATQPSGQAQNQPTTNTQVEVLSPTRIHSNNLTVQQSDTPTKNQKKTPNNGQTSQKTDTQQDEQSQEFKETVIKQFLGGNYNDLLKNEDTQKSIELNDDDPLKVKAIEAMLDRLESQELSFKYCRLCEFILIAPNQGFEAELPPVEVSKEDQDSNQIGNLGDNENQSQQTDIQGSPATPIGDSVIQSSTTTHPSTYQPPPIEENSLNYLITHVRDNKHHKKICNDLGIKEIEDMCFSILSFHSTPGDISKELIKEKEKALKRKVKKLRLTLGTNVLTHESAGQSQPWKDYSSPNKKTLQIKCMELEKQVNPIIRDYDGLEQNLREILKLLQYKNQGDLMLFRKLKFIPTLVDICKRMLICPKQEFKHLGKTIETSIKIIAIFCTQRENRNYMLLTNRLIPLVDLLTWCMNRPTQIFFGISFLPQLFNLITLHLKHKTPYECHNIKEQITEVLICSTLMPKIKNKFSIINYPMALDVSQMAGQVPMFLLKSISFLEALTSIVSNDAKFRPAYERNAKLGEHYLFVIENTEVFGLIQMLATLLLTHSEQFKTSCNIIEMEQATTKVMPQTFLSLAIVSIKVLNNVIRIDVKFVQEFMHQSKSIQDHLFHLLNYLLVYSHENFDKCEDTKELLHETLMFIGYYCLLNENTQPILHRGENTILQKLCNLPFPYFSDKKFKEILFPTLIMASYKSERSVAIMNQEMSLDPLIKFLQYSMKEELPRIMEEEFDYQSISSIGEPGKKNRGRGGARSPSISSNTSSMCSVPIETLASGNCPYLPLVMRFPKPKWQDAVDFYSKFNE